MTIEEHQAERMGPYVQMSDHYALALAADLLEMLAARCSAETVQCPTCKSTKRSDWDSWQIARKLLGMTESLHAIAGRIKHGSLRNPPPRAKQLPEQVDSA